MTVYSIANFGYEEVDYINLVFMHLGIVLFLVTHTFLYARAKLLAHRLDQEIITPRDYTIALKNVGTEVTKEDMKRYLEEKGGRITEIEFAYDLLESKKLDMKLDLLMI